MKHFLSLATVSFFSLFLFSCEKEYIEPAALETASVADARTASCDDYSYFNKLSGKVSFGKASGKTVLVGFSEGMSLQAREKVLSKYKQAQGVEGELSLDSGIMTEVKLVPGSTCFDAEKFISKILKEPSVSFAYPTFDPKTADPEEPSLGLTNEFMVSIEGSGTLQQLEKLVAKTKTKILFSFTDEIHVITTDKKSTGSVLEICTLFNKQSYITVAEPNVVYRFPPMEYENAAMNGQTAKTLHKGAFKAFQKEKYKEK